MDNDTKGIPPTTTPPASSRKKALTLVGTEDTSDNTEWAGEQLEPGFGSGPDTRRFLDSGELDIWMEKEGQGGLMNMYVSAA